MAKCMWIEAFAVSFLESLGLLRWWWRSIGEPQSSSERGSCWGRGCEAIPESWEGQMSLKMSAYGAGKVGTAPQEGLVRLGNNMGKMNTHWGMNCG